AAAAHQDAWYDQSRAGGVGREGKGAEGDRTGAGQVHLVLHLRLLDQAVEPAVRFEEAGLVGGLDRLGFGPQAATRSLPPTHDPVLAGQPGQGGAGGPTRTLGEVIT